MKTCSTPSALREIKPNPTESPSHPSQYGCHPENKHLLVRIPEKETTHTAGGNKKYRATMETYREVLPETEKAAAM